MCSRKQRTADQDVSSHANEDINSNSSNKFDSVRKFRENSKTSVRLTYFDGSRYVRKARLTRQVSKKSLVGSSDTINIRNATTKCKTCCDNVDQKIFSGTKSLTDMSSDTLPAEVCVRKVAGRVLEILDLLGRSGDDIGCADACWMQKLLKSVIRALDDLRSDCCRRPRQTTNLRSPRKKISRLSGAGSRTSLSSGLLQCTHPHNVCDQRAGPLDANLKKLIKAATDFGYLFGRYTFNSDKANGPS